MSAIYTRGPRGHIFRHGEPWIVVVLPAKGCPFEEFDACVDHIIKLLNEAAGVTNVPNPQG